MISEVKSISDLANTDNKFASFIFLIKDAELLFK